ncbi:hypothetical protein CL634_11385 [bacterium]|nr:hypothetical protein [bacterium]
MNPKLTIGMCTYDDFHGVYFSVMALRMYHSEIMDETEIIIIDNNPNSPHGKELKNFKGWIKNLRYIPYSETVGPANSKNQVFKNAKAPYVLCMDGHVMFENGSLKKLLDMYKSDPTTENLFQGPLVYDDLKNTSTHFDPVWRDQMWGIWATNKKGTKPDQEPFEIPMQGMGVFSSRKESWLGFNKLFRGFGAEEGYIHEKYRRAGHKTMCLPFLRWTHRFGRPDGVKYTLTMENKIRNYFIGHLENDMDVEPIIDHFKEWKSEEALEKICDEAYKEMEDNGYIK